MTDVAVGIIGVLSAAGGGWAVFNVKAQRRTLLAGADKTDAEAGEVINRTAIVLLTPLQNRIKELEVEVTVLRGKVREMNNAIDERDRTIHRQQLQMTDQQHQITELRLQVNGGR